MRRVYSYIRFSTPDQAEGHSLQRQADYARQYAEKHGLALDESLSMRDEGLSAYHQAHVRRGALGVFLRAVEEGLVPPGSILIVEGLDRLSRAEPLQAQAQLAQIITAGVSVITASDGKEYSRESLKKTPMDLLYALLVMIRAHEESDTKSRRVRASIHARVERWLDGSETGIIRQGRDPRWLRELPDKSGFELIPAYADGVRFIVERYLRGWGAVRITEEMNRLGMSAGTRRMSRGTVYRIIRNPALIGINRLEIDGRLYQLPGYYPAAISEQQWHELQATAQQREDTGRKGRVPAILTGFRTTYCGYCGCVMVGQTALNKQRPDGVLPEHARRLMCSDAGSGRRCVVTSSIRAVLIERAVLEYCSDAMNLASLVADDGAGSQARARLNRALARLEENTTTIRRMTDQFVTMDKVPAAFTAKVNALEKDNLQLTREVELHRSELAAFSSGDRPELMEKWRQLKLNAQALDPDARLHVRELIRQTFKRIDVYVKGVGMATDGLSGRLAKAVYGRILAEGQPVIDLVLHGRGGQVRLLSIDRQSGEWRAGRDFESSGLAARLDRLRESAPDSAPIE